MKKLKEYFLLIKTLRKRMVAVKEMMDLAEVSDVYAEYVCKMHNQSKWWMGGLSIFYFEIGQSFMNGYIKGLHDNGLEFKKLSEIMLRYANTTSLIGAAPQALEYLYSIGVDVSDLLSQGLAIENSPYNKQEDRV